MSQSASIRLAAELVDRRATTCRRREEPQAIGVVRANSQSSLTLALILVLICDEHEEARNAGVLGAAERLAHAVTMAAGHSRGASGAANRTHSLRIRCGLVTIAALHARAVADERFARGEIDAALGGGRTGRSVGWRWMTRDNSIDVEKLVREFKKGPRAVDGIDLHVDPGEIYGFLGPNGAGKSTTVLMLTTLLPPTAASARVGGYDVVKEGPKVRSVIGAALQEAALDPLLTGRDHVRLQTTLQGSPRPERRRGRTSCSSGSA